MKYYVYVYLDPRKMGTFNYNEYSFKYEPFYIGKGKGRRKDVHISNCNLKRNCNKYKVNKINNILKSGNFPIIMIIKNGIAEEDAFELEKYLIKVVGRLDKNTGPLTNMTDGGEGISGIIRNEVTKDKMRSYYKNMTSEEKQNFKLKCKESWTKDKRKIMSDYQKINSSIVKNPLSNPIYKNLRFGKLNPGTKYIHAIYDLTGKLIFKTDSVKELIKEFPQMNFGSLRKFEKTSNFYKGYYVKEYLIYNENDVANIITDNNILNDMKEYEIRYKVGLKLGAKNTQIQYYDYKIYKDEKIIFKSYRSSLINKIFGHCFLKKFDNSDNNIKVKYKGYELEKNIITLDYFKDNIEYNELY